MNVEKQGDFFGVDGIVPGSAEDIARRKKAIEAKQSEQVLDKVSEEYPSLRRMYDTLRNGGKE